MCMHGLQSLSVTATPTWGARGYLPSNFLVVQARMVDEEDGSEVRFVNFEEATEWMINKMNTSEEKKFFPTEAFWACELTGRPRACILTC
jgi:hypothetical protein